MKLNSVSRTTLEIAFVTASTIGVSCQISLAQGISEYGGLMGMPRSVPGSGHQDALNKLYTSPFKGIGGAPTGVQSIGSPTAQPGAGLAPQQVAALGKKANEVLVQAKKAEAGGNVAQAEKLYRETLAIRYRIWGERDTNIPPILDKLADISQAHGKPDDAAIYLNSILNFYNKRLGPGTSERIEPLKKLAKIAASKNDYKGEVSLWKQIYGLMERKSGVQEKDLVTAKLAWAEAAYKAKFYKDSEKLYESIIELKEKNKEPVDSTLAEHYAEALRSNGFEAEASAILKKYQSAPEPISVQNPSSPNAVQPGATESEKLNSPAAKPETK